MDSPPPQFAYAEVVDSPWTALDAMAIASPPEIPPRSWLRAQHDRILFHGSRVPAEVWQELPGLIDELLRRLFSSRRGVMRSG